MVQDFDNKDHSCEPKPGFDLIPTHAHRGDPYDDEYIEKLSCLRILTHWSEMRPQLTSLVVQKSCHTEV